MTSLRSSGLAALVATASAPVLLPLVLAACGSKPAVTPDPNATATATAIDPSTGVPASQSVPTTQATVMAPTATVAPTAPTATTPTGAPASSAGGIVSAASQAALDLLVQTAAAQDAPGMTPEGQPITGTLTEGQHADGLVTLQPGKCYTIIAVGSLNTLTNIDLTLLSPPLFNVNAGQDIGKINAVAVIGKGAKKLCPVLMFPVAYKVDILAHKGAGDVRAVLYSKSK